VNDAWIVLVGITVTTVLIRASGPLLLGGRRLPRPLTRVVVLLAPALLAALVVTETLSDSNGLVLDERALGVAAAGLSLLWRDSLLLAMAAAVLVTAAARAVL
jgi:hypothetical protein